jgi:hypothetical protein
MTMSGGIALCIFNVDTGYALAVLPPSEENPQSTRWTGGWMGPGASMDAEETRELSSPCLELNPGSSVI